MAGVNDAVFRSICKRMGAGLTYSEMISAKGLEYKNQKTNEMYLALEAEKPLAVQIFGSDPQIMARQASFLQEQMGEDLALIDINMGCPARKVTKNGDGSALMTQPKLAAQIMRAVVGAVGAVGAVGTASLPVTVKIRKGFAAEQDIAVEFAKLAEDCGVAAVAVHGRTAAQLYHGTADKEVVGRVKQALSIPVIASGDVFSTADVDEYRQVYKADAVMIARGARGNPWIFASRTPTLQERVEIAKEHTEGLAALCPAKLPSMRKHIAWYFKGTPHATAVRQAVNNCKTLDDYQQLFKQITSPCHCTPRNQGFRGDPATARSKAESQNLKED